MPSNAKSSLSVVSLGLACALLIGAGSLYLGARTEAAGPVSGIDARIINTPLQPVPVEGLVGAEQVGDWTVSLAGGISIDPGSNDVNVVNAVQIVNGNHRVARFDLNLDEEDPDQFRDIDTSGSTKIRISMTVNSSSSDHDVDISLLSMVPGEPNGSILERFTSSGGTRLYDLPGEQLRFRATMDDDDDDAFRQVIVTIWGD